MAGIGFVATSARYSTGVGESNGGVAFLSYAIRLASDESVTLSTGEKFNDLDGALTVRAPDDDHPLTGSSVGVFAYFAGIANAILPFPGNYLIEITVPHSRF